MAIRKATREVTPQYMRAAVVPASLDVEARTVELVWSTGAPVLRGYYEPYYEELSMDPKHVRMDRLQSGAAPLLNAHASYSHTDVIGVVESAVLKKGEGSAIVRFAKDEISEAIFQKIVDGIMKNVSVGYRIFKMEKVSDGEGQVPVYRAVDWQPYEISIVPVGADAGATVRTVHAITNACIFEERSMAPEEPQPNIAAAASTTAQTPAQAAQTQARSAPPAPAPAPSVADLERIRASAAADERERVTTIGRVGRALKRPEQEIQDAINKGTSINDYRAAAIDAHAAADTIVIERGGSTIEAGEDARDKWMRGCTAWLSERSGNSRMILEAAKLTGQKVDLDPGEFRGMRLLDLARMALTRSGVNTTGMSPMEIAGKALSQQRSNSGFAATGDFPLLLENALHKQLLAAYAITPDKWSRFCARGTVSDFKAHKRYRMGSFGSLSALNENGEFSSKAIPDASRESLTASTKGNIIGITRTAIVNDDMGAFSQMATMIGRAGRLSVERDVFALLALNAGLGPTMADGNTLFHASHSNISTGAALSAAALDADRVLMGSQVDVSGNEVLELRPAILVVPIGLGGQARVINDSAYDPDTLANKAQMKANIAGKMFNDIVDTSRISGTRRYAFADPAIAPVIEVAFLDGQEMPFMELREGWRVDGAEWKVRLDYGVAAVDFRGAVTNAGA